MSKNKAFKDKTFYRVVAVLLAICLWLYVDQIQNPMEEKLFEVPISYNNLPAGMAVSSETEYVKVRIQANSNVLDDVLAKDITAYLNLEDANIGQYVGNISIVLPDQVQLVSINPIDVSVDIQELHEQQAAVDVDTSGVHLADGSTMLTPLISPEQVVVSGAEANVDAIGRVYVVASVENLAGSQTLNLPVRVEDRAGNSLDNVVTVTPATVAVTLPVIGDSPSKVAPISATLVGEPAEGYAVSRIVIAPTIVSVYGYQSLLDRIDYVQTEAIDITDARSDVTANVGLVASDGIRYDLENQVSVLVQIESQMTRTFENVPISVINANNSFNYSLSSDTVSVTVIGPQTVVDAMSANGITAEIDVSGYVVGTATAEVKITVTGSAYVESYDPLSVTVGVTRK